MPQCSVGFCWAKPTCAGTPTGEALMTTYRFRWLNEKGDARKSMQIECMTDLHAIGLAAREAGDHEVLEVWDGSWLVCRWLRAHRSAAA
jgi:hypothetical protein